MFPLVFLLDVDNTLLNNDRVKEDLAREIVSVVGEDRAECFWQVYEDVRHEKGFVDFPATLDRFAAAEPAAPNERLRDIVMSVPFASYVYPGAIAALAYLTDIGLPVILSDGDPVFQAMKIERSGLAAAVEGRVLITVHKQQELDKVFDTYPSDHYALIDDKPAILADIEGRYPERFTTVLVCQGKYARVRGFSPPPDLVVPHIADLTDIPREEFLVPGS